MNRKTIILLALATAIGCASGPKSRPPEQPIQSVKLPAVLEEELEQLAKQPAPPMEPPVPVSVEARRAVLEVRRAEAEGVVQRWQARVSLVDSEEQRYLAAIGKERSAWADEVPKTLDLFRQVRSRFEAELRRHEDELRSLTDALEALDKHK